MNNNVYPWQRNLLRQLISARAQLPNALLLQGKDGIGKHRFASVLSQALLCDAPMASGEPCGQCTSCGWFMAGGHPDFRLLAPEAQDESTEPAGAAADQGKPADKKASKYIIVAQVRELADFVNLTTHRNGPRIILIHPAEAMNAQAANALLKTLEEPPAGTLFILVSHQPQRLLPTVRSRCRKVNAPSPDRKEAMLWLHEQGLADAGSFLAQSGYAPLAALQLSDADHQAKRSQVFAQLAAPRAMDPLALAEQGEKLGLAWMLQWLQQWVYDLASLGLTGQARYQAEPSPETVRLAKTVSLIELFKFQHELSAAQRTLQHPLNPRLVLEQLLLSYWQTANRQESAHV